MPMVENKMFPCERCGCCCRKIGEIQLVKYLALQDGSCKYLDKESNLCKIYSDRPIFCRIDDFYDKFLSQVMTREYFYQQNKLNCKIFQTEQKNKFVKL